MNEKEHAQKVVFDFLEEQGTFGARARLLNMMVRKRADLHMTNKAMEEYMLGLSRRGYVRLNAYVNWELDTLRRPTTVDGMRTVDKPKQKKQPTRVGFEWSTPS